MQILNSGNKPHNTVDRFRFCERLADGTVVEFNRVIVTNSTTGASISTTDTNLDGTAYTVVDENNVSECAPPQIVEKTVGRERITADDTTAAAPASTPASADLAYIQVVSGCGFFSDDGTAVLADGSVGFQLAQGGSAKVCDADIPNLSVISETGGSVSVEVVYKQCVVKTED